MEFLFKLDISDYEDRTEYARKLFEDVLEFEVETSVINPTKDQVI